MRYLFGFLCVCALGVMGCSETTGTGGSGGGGVAACEGNVCPCTEAGIRAAIAKGGGPVLFDCDGPTTVVTQDEIVINNDVKLDGEGNLTVDGGEAHRLFSVAQGVTTELRGFKVTRGAVVDESGGGSPAMGHSPSVNASYRTIM